MLGEIERDHKLFKQVENMALQRGSLFIPVKLLISEEENKKRVANPERALRYKSIKIDQNSQLINISHPNFLEIDVSDLFAPSVAEKILEHANNIKSSKL